MVDPFDLLIPRAFPIQSTEHGVYLRTGWDRMQVDEAPATSHPVLPPTVTPPPVAPVDPTAKRCFRCRLPGHFVRDCPSLKGKDKGGKKVGQNRAVAPHRKPMKASTVGSTSSYFPISKPKISFAQRGGSAAYWQHHHFSFPRAAQVTLNFSGCTIVHQHL